MYEAFFGLSVKPFELVPNPDFLFHSRSHRKALNYLKYGLREKAGFIMLTGEVGSGKTTIIRDLIADMDSDIVLAMLFNTRVSTKQILAMINEDFGLPVAGHDKVALLRELNDFLVEQHAQNRHPVVIIDESQNLSPAALEEIRLLSNLEANDAKLLQIIMVGQPELKKTIAKHELRQLRQRISVHCHLDPLNRNETEQYVFHRLELAGNRNAVNWGGGTFDALYRYSHGIPRLINIFCDFILLAAFVEGTRNLDLDLVEEVLGDTSWDQHIREQQHQEATGATPVRQGIIERLAEHEQKITQLDELNRVKDEFALRIKSLEDMLDELRMQQEGGFRRMQADMERTSQHLQAYLAGLPARQTKPVAASANKAAETPVRKSLLGKFFS